MTSKPDNRGTWRKVNDPHPTYGFNRFFLEVDSHDNLSEALGPLHIYAPEWVIDRILRDHNQAQLVERLRAALEDWQDCARFLHDAVTSAAEGSEALIELSAAVATYEALAELREGDA